MKKLALINRSLSVISIFPIPHSSFVIQLFNLFNCFLHKILCGILWFSCLLLPAYFLLLSLNLFSQTQLSSTYFKHITTADGLSQNTTNCIFKDSKGYMWFGTTDGLNQYDGFHFKIFRYNPYDESSISNNNIKAIYEDNNGFLWIATYGGGINKFDRITQKFVRFMTDGTENSLKSNNINCLASEKSGLLWIGSDKGLNKINTITNKVISTFESPFVKEEKVRLDTLINCPVQALFIEGDSILWIGTFVKGIIKYNLTEKTYKQYKNIPDNPNSLSDNFVQAIYVSAKEQTVYIGTLNGLCRLNKSTDKFYTYKNDPNDPRSINGNNITAINGDETGAIWVGIFLKGVDRFYPKAEPRPSSTKNSVVDLSAVGKEVFTHFYNQLNYNRDIRDNWANTIYYDKSGIIWLGTQYGVSKTVVGVRKFSYYFHDENNPNTISSNYVNTIFEDTHGFIWFGTTRGGLNKYDRKTRTFTAFKHSKTDPNSIICNTVNAIVQDKQGSFWLGANKGLAQFNPASTQLKKFIHYFPQDISGVTALLIDNSGVLWIGTKDKGLFRYKIWSVATSRRMTGQDTQIQDISQLKNYKYNETSSDDKAKGLTSNFITDIYQNQEGQLWVGTFGGGLCLFDPNSEKFTCFKNNPKDTNTISSNNIEVIAEDKHGNLWFGTNGGGLNKFIKENKTFKHYTEKQGLCNNSIMGMVFDDYGNLWLGTYKGLARFNPLTEEFINYDISDGLQDNEFTKAACKTKDGYLIFGGVRGFNMFHPDSIQHNKSVPSVIITSIKRFNKEMPLPKHISELTELNLSYKDYEFTIEFSALDYHASERNKYAYLMDGFDDDWIEVGHRQYAAYSKLPPGRYTFHVTGCNNDGVWNFEGASLKIYIKPPFWKTWWFYLILGIIIGGTILLIFIIREIQAKLRERELEQKVQERTAQLAKKTDRLETKQLTLEFALTRLEEKRKMLEEKNKEITEDICYVKELKDYSSPTEERIKQLLPESFVLFIPKNTLSRDTYWIEQYPNGVLIASIDCFGHNIVGAMLSIISNNLLSNAVTNLKYYKPSDLLNELNRGISLVLKQTFNETAKETLDVILLNLEFSSQKLFFTSTKNPLYLFKNGELKIFKPNKVTLGKDANLQFTDEEIILEKNNEIYIFTDGYINQPGGTDGKEFSITQFNELLVSIHKKPMAEQKIIFHKTFETWKGSHKQIDDIMVIGIRV